MSRTRVFFASFAVTLLNLSAATFFSFRVGDETVFIALFLAASVVPLGFLRKLAPARFWFWGTALAAALFYFLFLPLFGLLGCAVLGLVVTGLLKRGQPFPKLDQPRDLFSGVLGFCSFLFPLLLAANLHRLYGNVIYHFALTPIVFLAFCGIGSWGSRWLESTAAYGFPLLQFGKALLGAGSAFAVMELAATHDGIATLLSHFAYVAILGFIAGAEIPLLERWRKTESTQPYGAYGIGAVASVAAFVGLSAWLPVAALIPSLITLSLLLLVAYRHNALEMPVRAGIFALLALLIGRYLYLIPTYDVSLLDRKYYAVSPNSAVVLSLRTRHQKILAVLTPSDDVEPEDEQFPEFEEAVRAMSGLKARDKWLSIYRNSSMQVFSPLASETDFFHHAFVHPAMLTAASRKHVLILGGGDGLAAKEVVKYSDVEAITIVERDAGLAEAVKTNATLREHTADALNHPKVKILSADPIRWASHETAKYDVILVDSIDDTSFPFFRRYTLGFLEGIKPRLNDGGSLAMAVDNFDTPGFWNIVRTAFEAGFALIPHHSLDPSGFEGLLLLSHEPKDLEAYAESFAARPFVLPGLLLTPQALEYYARPEISEARSQNYPVNTAYRPTFLRYYPGALPWAIPNSQD